MARRFDSRGASPLLSVLAVLLVAGLFYWLYLQSQAAENDVEPVTEEEAAGELVDFIPAQLMESPRSLYGDEGVLRNVSVSQSLGRGVLSIDLDGENEFPVLLGPDLIAQGTSVSGGDRITVYGTVYALNDSIRGAWVEGQAVEQGNADAIPGTESFVLADSVTFN